MSKSHIFKAFAFSAASIGLTMCASANITSKIWGKLPDGQTVHLYSLSNKNGMKVVISDFGGIVNQLYVPGKQGEQDVVLGLQTPDQYLKESPYFGAIIGRYANRIGNGTFHLDGKTYHLALNNVNHGISCTLHGGKIGFDKKVFSAKEAGTENSPSLILTYVSKDGEENFPGTLTLQVTYSVLPNNALKIQYRATTTKATPINFTNHAYFNLSGEGNGTIYHDLVQINAKQFTPTTKGMIPTGKIENVVGTPFDWLTPHTVGERINDKNQQLEWAGGYDQNYVLDKPLGKYGLAAKVYDPHSHRLVTVYTSEPGFQLYTGNFLDGTIKGISGKKYLHRGALTLETQHYPDSPNHSNFPTTILHPGQVYTSTTEYVFSEARGI